MKKTKPKAPPGAPVRRRGRRSTWEGKPRVTSLILSASSYHKGHDGWVIAKHHPEGCVDVVVGVMDVHALSALFRQLRKRLADIPPGYEPGTRGQLRIK